MKVAIFGTGYVGLVSGACLAEVGHQVISVDIDEAKLDSLRRGVIPIYEPGLESLVKDNIGRGNLKFTNDAESAIDECQLLCIAVGTPSDEDGSADLTHVLAVAETIGRYIKEYRLIVTKSTVPVGTTEKIVEVLGRALRTRESDIQFDVASNPEFLKEGNAVSDFMKPDRIVVGTSSDQVKSLMRELYEPFNRNHDRMMFMDVRSAELTKYAANAMLATKISFINELANLAEKLGADIEYVRQGIGADSRIGYQFIYPGCGYGGSCFPKDVRALLTAGMKHDCEVQLLNAVNDVNERQKNRLFEKIVQFYGDDLTGKIFALWGLSFKPQTNDMREAASCRLMESLWRAGAAVQAFDPVAMDEARRMYGARDDLKFCATKEEALTGTDGLVICTEWKSFRSPNFEHMLRELSQPVIFDGRNMYDPKRVEDEGLTYFGIGRGESIKQVTGLKSE